MTATQTTRAGHLAIDQIRSAVSPMPSRAPSSRAIPPVSTTIRAQAQARIMSTRVSPTRTGNTFHSGRPSGRS
ncbi:hypothetical protein SBADM41S_11607 [Streptomyces badius]